MNSGLSGRGPAWSKILQCRDLGRSCSVCSKLDDCFESLFNEAKGWGSLHHHHFWYFLVVMTMMFMLMMRTTMMIIIKNHYERWSKRNKRCLSKYILQIIWELNVNNLLLSVCMSCQLYDMQICYKLQICCHNVLFNTHTQHSLCAFV